MRVLCAAMGAALFALSASAAPLKEGKDWRNCAADEQCVVIDAACGKTAVTKIYEKDARAYYKQQAKTASCVQRFWMPKSVVPQCRLNSCEAAAQPATQKKK